jgi:hypothetical protein
MRDALPGKGRGMTGCAGPVVVAWAALSLPGCFPGCGPIDEGVSMGEMGRAEFAWDEGILGCLFGCDAEEAMAARAVTYMSVVNGDELPTFTVSSDDPSVLTFVQDEPGDERIRCESHAAGSARIVLADVVSGGVIDRFRIDVRDVAAIRPSDGELYDETYTIMAGGMDAIYLDLLDGRGRTLVGVGGVDYALEGGLTEEGVTLVGALADLLVSILVGTTREYVTVEAVAAGSGSIVVSAPSGVHFVMPAAIVDASAVGAVSLSSEGAFAVGEQGHVEARALAGGERVHSPECAWTIEPAGGPVTIDSEGRDYLDLASTAAGSATVTCAVGSASDSIHVSFR